MEEKVVVMVVCAVSLLDEFTDWKRGLVAWIRSGADALWYKATRSDIYV